MANHDEGKRGSRAQCDDNVVVAVVGALGVEIGVGLVCCPTTNHNLLLNFSSISLCIN